MGVSHQVNQEKVVSIMGGPLSDHIMGGPLSDQQTELATSHHPPGFDGNRIPQLQTEASSGPKLNSTLNPDAKEFIPSYSISTPPPTPPTPPATTYPWGWSGLEYFPTPYLSPPQFDHQAFRWDGMHDAMQGSMPAPFGMMMMPMMGRTDFRQ